MKKLIVLVAILLIAIAGTGFWWSNGLLPANSSNKTPVIFIVKKGEGVREIANHLKSQNLIKDPIVFFLFTRIQGLDKQIEAGDFRINPSMSAEDIANNLTHGTLDIWVTIPEGQRALEIAQTLKDKLPGYQDSWNDILVKNEGYLFPDTYLIPRDADINFIVNLMTNNFKSKYSTLGALGKSSLTQNQIVIVASLVEREAKNDTDRPLVASVILNRLNIGMKLDIDATIQYALGYQADQKRWWKKDLTTDDLSLNSPYNTYKVSGLPPTPISNPGLASLNAVVNPANTNYLFYMTDSKGITHFAATIEEHNANIKKFGTD